MEIELKNINYKNIFRKLNMKISDNKITVIIGKNGSGKTSIMNMISGYETEFSGEIKIGDNILNKENAIKIREEIGYLKQDYEDELFNTSVLEDLKLGINDFDMVKFNDLMNSFELDESILKKNYIDLSISEIKRILIIKLFLKDNKLILIDDITNGLDRKSIQTFGKLLKREKKNGKAIVVTSMDSNFLLSISDRIIIIDNGKIKESNNKYEVFSNKTLLDSLDIEIPRIIDFNIKASKKKIKLLNVDNTNDLIKDIYRHASTGTK